jgi:uncharacterized RDD family membrane protein YckC
VLAPYGRRFLAAVIDALPVLGTLVVVFMNLSPEQRENMDMDAVATAAKWPRYIATGVYVFHTLLTEVTWGWTIGKKLVGLRVTLLDGTAPSRGSMVWRNVLRIVDVAMVFPALLVFITPLRQRVGDVAAETIVVVRGPVKTPLSTERAGAAQSEAQSEQDSPDRQKGKDENG